MTISWIGTFFLLFAFISILLLIARSIILLRKASQRQEDVPMWREKWTDRLLWRSYHSAKTRQWLADFGLEATRERLIRAGYYHRHALMTYIIIKVFSVLVVLLIVYLFLILTKPTMIHPVLLFIVVFAVVLLAARIPRAVLRRRERKFHEKLFKSLPVFLNLFAMCLESGYSIDIALQKTAAVIAPQHPLFARELLITYRQLQLYEYRTHAWKNFEARVGFFEMESIIRILEQNEKLGTAVSANLQRHSRKVKQQQLAAISRKIERIPIHITALLMLIFVPIMIILIATIVASNVVDLLPKLLGA